MIEEIKNELNYTFTENGAKVYKTTGTELLDLNFQVPSLRGESCSNIVEIIKSAFLENPELFYQWVFYLRNCRGGLGERETFRNIMKCLCSIDPDRTKKVLDLISYYGRWDDLISLTLYMSDPVIAILKEQIKLDIEGMKESKPVSLLAKWMPSINAGKKNRQLAIYLAEKLGYSKKQYRQILSSLRAYLDVVEVKMCAGEWSKIDYSKVPSNAGLLHMPAFRKHDGVRYGEYINQVVSGESKINSDVLFPYEIYAKCSRSSKEDQAALNEMWKALPNFIEPDQNTIVVVDGSGSMTTRLNGSVRAIDVARSLGIYFSERNTCLEYKDKFITFSSHPELVDLSKCNTLSEKIEAMSKYNDLTNTDLKKVFQLVLNAAVHNNLSQDQLPKNILIIFDKYGIFYVEFLGYIFIRPCNRRKRCFRRIEY